MKQKGKREMRNFRLTDESGHQEAIFEWRAYQVGKYPELALLHHVPNGGKRDKTTATTLKRQGVRAGVPDLVLPVARCGYHGLYIELKAPGGALEQAQIDFLQAVEQEDYLALVCVGWRAAAQVLTAYMEQQEPQTEPLTTKATPKEGAYRYVGKGVQHG